MKKATKKEFVERTSNRVVHIILSGIILFVAVFLVTGRIDRTNTDRLMLQTLDTLEKQCINYDKAEKMNQSEQLFYMTDSITGFRMEKGGVFLILKDGKVIATNNSSLQNKNAQSSSIINELEQITVQNKLTRFTDSRTGYVGGARQYKNYTMYVYFTHVAVYSGCRVLAIIFVCVYILFWCVYFFAKNRVLKMTQEEILREARNAQSANEAKTEFLRRISHDIRTPINGIQGMIKIAEKFPDDAAKQAVCREKVLMASNFLLDLVNDVLDMSKLETDEIVLENKAFTLKEIFEQVDLILSSQAEQSGIKYVAEDKPKVARTLMGSPLHVRQILMNIAGNAIKYGKPGGYVKVSSFERASDENTVTYEFVCEDNGIGMSEEFQKHMFEPFMQEKNDARTNYQGTGLGLAIVDRLVKKMNGSITVDSNRQNGTVFKITIPFEIAADSVKTDNNSGEIDNNVRFDNVNALLVEDNELNMEIAEFMLQEYGVHVTKAWNGQQAADIFLQSENNSFDIIFMDIMMPVMNGLEATRIIRAMDRPDAASIPIIAMSANAFSDDIERNKQAGMNDHISKPIDEKYIVKVLAEYCIV